MKKLTVSTRHNDLQTVSIHNVRTMTSVALLAAISFALALFELPVPLSPSFAKMDISDFPALIGAMTMGPWAGVGELANYFILLPLFETFMPMDALITSFAEFIPFIHTKLDVVLLNAIPFNLLKGIGISFLTLLIYRRLIPVFRGSF